MLWFTSRMKSPGFSPALSAALPGSMLSRYCKAGNSAVGRKSSSPLGLSWAENRYLKLPFNNYIFIEVTLNEK